MFCYYFINNNNYHWVFAGGEKKLYFPLCFCDLGKGHFWFPRNCRFHVLMLKGVKQGRAQLYYFSGS